MAAHGPFLGRLSNPVSPHVFPLIHVRSGLVVELEHTGPHASENHLSVPLEHHLSTPIWTASHSGCWVGAALLLAVVVVVVVVVVECVCVCVCGVVVVVVNWQVYSFYCFHSPLLLPKQACSALKQPESYKPNTH